jgi:xylan 1,4-beta-xylosidase
VFAGLASKVEFDKDELGLDWNYIQAPVESNFSLTEREGFLRLKGAAETISINLSSTFVGRRLKYHYFTATTQLEFDPKNENEEAGLILLNNGSHFDILVRKKDDERFLKVKLQFGQTIHTSKEYTLKPGPVKLRVSGDKTTFTFSFAQNNDEYTAVETANAKFLATETVGFFTGIYVGLYATGNGQESEVNAYYD